MDCRAVGLVVTGLGGNRRREDDVIDPAVGLTEIAPTGAQVGPDRPLAVVHAASEAAADEAIAALRAAVTVGDEAPPERPGDRGEDRVRLDVPAPDTTLPKAELHVHLEGTAPPSLIRRLAERNGMTVPEGVFRSDDEFEWSDFLHFLRTYDLAASVIRTPEDYRDVTFEYLSSCAAEGAIYVEVIASPDHAAAVGLSDADHYAGIAQGIDDARAAHGIEARIVIAAVRNLGVEAAEAIVAPPRGRPPPVRRRLQPRRRRGGLAGEPVRARVRDRRGSGLGCTVHAGEHDGPASIRAALELPITRMSHGVRAIEDPALVAELAERGDRARGVSELERGHSASSRATTTIR